MADKGKPYKVYRGGRVAGPIRAPAPAREGRRDGDGYAGTRPQPVRKRGRWVRRIGFALVALILLTVLWAALGFLALRNGVKEANARLDEAAKRAVTPQDGSIMSTPTNFLLIGADAGPGKGRPQTGGLSDSIMLVRSDPDAHRFSLLSIPRDLRVPIEGQGESKINAAYLLGGAALTVETVESLTGLRVNHVIVLDFNRFAEVIDALGGITVNVRKPILSRFECPYGAERCRTWRGWRFNKGEQEMNGRRALIYSRVRRNLLEPGASDFTRISYQQQVVQAIGDKATSFGTFLRLPLIGDDLVSPLTTDLSAGELLQLAWVKRRSPAGSTIRCRLGGTLSSDGSYLIAEDTRLVIAMITGEAAPQPPRAGAEVFGPGCFVGRT